MSYSESFLLYADDRGLVDIDIASQLLEEHGTDFQTIIADGYKEDVTNGEAY